MTGAELIEEAQRLAKPCAYLSRESDDGEIAGVWGGPGVVRPQPEPFRHWISIDARGLPVRIEGLDGWLSVYTNEDDCITGRVETDSDAEPDPGLGVPLIVRPGLSMPPTAAVFRFGSAAVQEWLAGHGWNSEWGYNNNFKGRAIVWEYQSYLQERHPLYTGDAHAVLGGWHEVWPDGDWQELLEKNLVVWTFAESEPWVEVWHDGERFQVIQRIT